MHIDKLNAANELTFMMAISFERSSNDILSISQGSARLTIQKKDPFLYICVSFIAEHILENINLYYYFCLIIAFFDI